MAQAIKCDRCGRFFENKADSQIVKLIGECSSEESYFYKLFIKDYFEHDYFKGLCVYPYRNKGVGFDLCYDCWREFVIFMDGKEHEDGREKD